MLYQIFSLENITSLIRILWKGGESRNGHILWFKILCKECLFIQGCVHVRSPHFEGLSVKYQAIPAYLYLYLSPLSTSFQKSHWSFVTSEELEKESRKDLVQKIISCYSFNFVSLGIALISFSKSKILCQRKYCIYVSYANQHV